MEPSNQLSKVPKVTFMFWVIKVCATTLGETGGDAVSMSLNLGYLMGSFIFLGCFLVALAAQMKVKKFHPFAYWAVVVATTTVGTTLSDYLDRTVGLGYAKSSLGLILAVLAVLATWKASMGKIEYEQISRPDDELFYWTTILLANTLGTALGDYTADDAGFGFEGGALLFGVILAVIAATHFLTKIPDSALFWAAYIISRPLGATLGDLMTKPQAEGGLDLSRISSSGVIAAAMVIMIFLTYRRPDKAANPADSEKGPPTDKP